MMEAKTMHECPTCEGKGKMTITAKTLTDDGWKDENPVDIDCVICDGGGTVTRAKLESIEHEKRIWCECGNPSEDVNFWDDGEGYWVTKHHYTCKDCGKVVQIG